jgi:hypothetical protein
MNRMEDLELPLIQPLTSVYESHGDYHHLLDWGNFRYHLPLQYNNTNPDAEENMAMRSF